MFNVIVLRGDYSALIKQMFKMDTLFGNFIFYKYII